MVGALRVDPEFQHPALRMERAGNVAVALEFANIADVHQEDAGIVFELDRLLRGYGLDLLFGLGAQFLNRFLELQGHHASPPLFLSLALTASATRDGRKQRCYRASRAQATIRRWWAASVSRAS